MFWLGLHAPLDDLLKRELERGDRDIGEAAYHLKTHQFIKYDLEINSTRPLEDNVREVADAVKRRFDGGSHHRERTVPTILPMVDLDKL